MDELRGHIARLREDFTQGRLDEGTADKDPAQQFRIWMHQAVEAQVPEVHAMNLCTVSKENKPSSRIVYLREFDGHDYWFYTNYKSRKGHELSENPNAAITFFWPQLERQIRIEGIVTIAPPDKSDTYFESRPAESRIGAWASKQSEILSSRDALEQAVNAVREKFGKDEIVRPPHWGGYKIRANYYEFWQGRPSRLHDRLAYIVATDGNWTRFRLAP
jgi:pyridoxamine 5'-phosphate oxidase